MVWLQIGNFAQAGPSASGGSADRTCRSIACRSQSGTASELGGRTILIVAEQGLGDTIQFIRYVPLVGRRGGRVVVTCARMLSQILATCPGVDQVIIEGDPCRNSPVMPRS